MVVAMEATVDPSTPSPAMPRMRPVAALAPTNARALGQLAALHALAGAVAQLLQRRLEVRAVPYLELACAEPAVAVDPDQPEDTQVLIRSFLAGRLEAFRWVRERIREARTLEALDKLVSRFDRLVLERAGDLGARADLRREAIEDLFAVAVLLPTPAQRHELRLCGRREDHRLFLTLVTHFDVAAGDAR